MTTEKFDDLCCAGREAWRRFIGAGCERDRLPAPKQSEDAAGQV